MPRQLVVCLDGTGNRFDHTPTNIIRILRSLSADEKEVVSYYDQGVGTFGLKETLFEWQKLPARICGLAFGWGLSRTVQGAYEFLARTYQPGDELFFFGFSRGAYTVRALAALINACGLVEPHQLNMFDYAWAMLIARKRKKDVLARNEPLTEIGRPDFALQRYFLATFGRSVPIKFLGIFDTVKSVGWISDPTVIPFSGNNPKVAFVRHAISIDERRCFFRPNAWGPRDNAVPDTPTHLPTPPAHPSDPVATSPADTIDTAPAIIAEAVPAAKRTDVVQVWFAGVHSDVGGGYTPATTQLASVTLCWMLGEAIAQGLKINQDAFHSELRLPEGSAPDMLADAHDSMLPAWKLAEWAPVRRWELTKPEAAPNTATPAIAAPKRYTPHWRLGTMPPFGKPRPRTIPEGALLHVSVKRRLLERPDYRPINLPEHYSIVNDNPKSPCS